MATRLNRRKIQNAIEKSQKELKVNSYNGIVLLCFSSVPNNLLSISLGIVRSSMRDWTQRSWLTAHTIGKIVSDTKVIFSTDM